MLELTLTISQWCMFVGLLVFVGCWFVVWLCFPEFQVLCFLAFPEETSGKCFLTGALRGLYESHRNRRRL